MLMLCVVFAAAQKKAEIKFDKVVHNFGTFSESSPVQNCVFTFTNTGNGPLIINQAVADTREIQRRWQIPRSFQEEHHCAHKCRD